MAPKNQITQVLTDVESSVWVDEAQITPQSGVALAGSPNWSIKKRRLRGGASDGVDVVEIDNGALSVSVLPTRGMGVWRGKYRGLELGWQSPVKQPVHPAFVDQSMRNGIGWLAGFNEWLCRCGLASHGAPGVDVVRDAAGSVSETPLTLHGRIANIPAHHVEVAVSSDGDGTLTVRGVVDETMMFGTCLRLTSTLSTTAGSNRLTIIDEVTNLAGKPTEMELLYHTNFGPPFLEAGARFVAPFQEVAPRDGRAAEDIGHWQEFLAPEPTYTEQCYFVELAANKSDQTTVMLRNSAGDKAVSMTFDRRQLPSFTLWKNTQSLADGYVTGLEPGTSLPNLKTFEREQGRIIVLAPGASYTMQLEIAVHDTAEQVRAIEDQIASLQKSAAGRVHAQPQPRLSPGA